jgi:hypothetical protein
MIIFTLFQRVIAAVYRRLQQGMRVGALDTNALTARLPFAASEAQSLEARGVGLTGACWWVQGVLNEWMVWWYRQREIAVDAGNMFDLTFVRLTRDCFRCVHTIYSASYVVRSLLRSP